MPSSLREYAEGELRLVLTTSGSQGCGTSCLVVQSVDWKAQVAISRSASRKAPSYIDLPLIYVSPGRISSGSPSDLSEEIAGLPVKIEKRSRNRRIHGWVGASW